MGGLKNLSVTTLALVALGAAAQTLPRKAPSPAAAQARQADPLQEAEALLQTQQYAQAEEKLQALISAQGKNPQAWFDLGFSLSHQGKTQEAIAAYRKAVELAPDWFEANLNLGVDLARAGNSAAAVPVLKHAVELKPTSGGPQALRRAWLSLAQAMEEEKSDLKGAAAAYDKASDYNPPDAQLTTRAGILLQKAGDAAGAEQHYRKAADAGDAGGMAQLVNLLSSQKRYADAETWLHKYAAQNPQDPAASAQLGRLLAAEGKIEAAIAVLQPLSGPAAPPDINRTLAELYLDNKQYAEAAPLLQQSLEKNQTDPQLRLDFGLALLHQLKYAEAEAELLKAVKLKPDLADAYGYLAEAARQNQHYELCLRALDARARFLPETPGTYFLRATAYDSLRMYKPAVANYKLFLAAAAGKYPDQEFQARHRLKAIEPQ
jgi:tetratricopeptide (TPR) repeat protein